MLFRVSEWVFVKCQVVLPMIPEIPYTFITCLHLAKSFTTVVVFAACAGVAALFTFLKWILIFNHRSIIYRAKHNMHLNLYRLNATVPFDSERTLILLYWKPAKEEFVSYDRYDWYSNLWLKIGWKLQKFLLFYFITMDRYFYSDTKVYKRCLQWSEGNSGW